MSLSTIDLKGLWKKAQKSRLVFALSIAGILGLGALGSTLAANINLNSGNNVEFGQGVASTTACSGSNSITVTPNSEFKNEVGAGASYFTSVTLSNIPANCLGKVFTIAAYGDSGSALAFTNCSDAGAKLAVIFNGASGTAPTAQSYNQMYSRIAFADSTSFTITWHDLNSPCYSVALANSVTKIAIQSSDEAPADGDYIADFTSGSTNFNSTPLVAFDANDAQPVGSTWSNTGSIQGDGDLTFNTAPSVTTGSNSYAELTTSMQATGSVGPAPATADRMTVEMWVNFHDAGNTYDATLFSFGTNDSRGEIDCGYNLSFNEGYFGINTCNSDTLGIDATQLNDGWHHIVWIASTGARYTQKIYLDGSLLEHLVRYNNGDNPDLQEKQRPYIGSGHIGVNSWMFNGLSLKLGALKVYPGEMSPSTVATHSASFHSR